MSTHNTVHNCVLAEQDDLARRTDEPLPVCSLAGGLSFANGKLLDSAADGVRDADVVVGGEGDRSGFKYCKLPKIGFVPESDRFAFGFLDPSVVIRGCHLIPAFAQGRTGRLLRANSTFARNPGEKKDWINYYVGM